METQQTQQIPLWKPPDADGLITDPNDGAKLAYPARAAELVDVSLRTIYHWIERRKVRVRYAAGGMVLVEVASLFTQEKPATARVGRGESAA